MPIVLITDALLRRSTLRDGRLLRDRMLSGFVVRMNPRKHTFRVASSVAGKQFRTNLVLRQVRRLQYLTSFKRPIRPLPCSLI